MSAVWTINRGALKWWGREHGWYTAGAIAEGIGVAPSTLSRVMSGKSTPGEALLAAVRLAFGDDAFTEIFTVADDGAPTPAGTTTGGQG